MKNLDRILKKYKLKKNEVLGFSYIVEKYIIIDDLLYEYSLLNKEHKELISGMIKPQKIKVNELINILFDMYQVAYKLNRKKE